MSNKIPPITIKKMWKEHKFALCGFALGPIGIIGGDLIDKYRKKNKPR